jgi:hypothetical protein
MARAVALPIAIASVSSVFIRASGLNGLPLTIPIAAMDPRQAILSFGTVRPTCSPVSGINVCLGKAHAPGGLLLFHFILPQRTISVGVSSVGASTPFGRCSYPPASLINLERKPRIAVRSVNLMEANMMRLWNILGCAIAFAAVLSLAGASAQAQQGDPQGGSVTPCSLAGVNPADHPAIFNNPDVARSQYGFVRGPDGNWTVMPNCQAIIDRR